MFFVWKLYKVFADSASSCRFCGGGAFRSAAAPFAISGGAQRDLDYDKRRPFFNFSPRENAPAFLPRNKLTKYLEGAREEIAYKVLNPKISG